MPDNLDSELARIEKDYGKGTVIRGLTGIPEKVDVIGTGSLMLDIATRIGGLPRGKIVEILGWESSGKSTIVMQTIANAQKQGLNCLYVDGEQSFDIRYARKLGVNIDQLLISQPDEGGAERYYNIAERLIKTREIGVVVFDSQTSLLPKAIIDGEIGQSALGVAARMMSQSVPKILTSASSANCLVIYISQMREKIGVLFGSPETTSGGNALKFYSHMRIEARRTLLKEDGQPYANKCVCKVIKNKLAVPFGQAEFRINWGTGVDRNLEILELAIEKGIIAKSGSWYSFDNNRLGQGEDNVLTLLNDNEDLARDIERRVLGNAGQ